MYLYMYFNILEKIKSKIREMNRYTIIDKLIVKLNEKRIYM